jgi:hypothetical protein
VSALADRRPASTLDFAEHNYELTEDRRNIGEQVAAAELARSGQMPSMRTM